MRQALIGCLAAFALLASSATAQPNRTPKPLALAAPGEGPVYVVPVEGMIDNALASYLDRAIADAEADGAALLLFDIDTFGGLVDAADHIRKAFLNTEVPTVAFIDRNAASAGALISYAADRIVMVPGASIGAATVVEGVGGEAAPDKYQSYMRGLMRSTAEVNGRDPRIAEAMVDESLDVPGISPAGQVLTLSAQEALRLGVADAVLATSEEVITAYGLDEARIEAHQASRTERLLRFFASPIVQSILMLMMLGGLYFELQTPGVGFAGAMALLGAAAFFAPHYLMGLVESWEILLFGIGVALLLAEIFVIPGFGIAGISGIVLIMVSLVVSLIGNVGFRFPGFEAFSPALGTLAVTLVLLVLLIISVGRYLPRSERFSRLVLEPDLSSATGYVAFETDEGLLGQTGTALTVLRPSGAAEINGVRVDVVTSGDFIARGEVIEVVSVRGSRVEVRRVRALSTASATTAPSVSKDIG